MTASRHTPGRAAARRRGWLGAALLALAAGGPAGAAASGWPHDASDLRPDPAVRFGQLANGVRYAVLPHAVPPARLSLRLLVTAGSLMEEAGERGLAHFVEHMAFAGTRNFPRERLVGHFQELGMAYGADTNAMTSPIHTEYRLELPITADRVIEDSLAWLRDVVDGLAFDAGAVDSERRVIAAERLDADTPPHRAVQAELEFLLPGSVLSQRPVLGDAAVTDAAGPDDLKRFWRRWYRPDRVVVVAVGDVPADRMTALIERHFASLEGAAPPDPDIPVPVLDRTGIAVHDDPGLDRARVRIRAIGPRGLDDHAGRVARLRLAMANDMLTRRLRTIARGEAVPIDDGHAMRHYLIADVASSTVEVSGPSRQWRGLLHVAERELRRALVHGFTDNEVAESRRRIRNAFEQRVRLAPTRLDAALAERIVASVLAAQVFTDPQTDLALALEAIDGFDAAAATAALRAAWDTGHRRVLIAGDLGVDDPEREAGTAWSWSLAQPVSAPFDRDVAPFAYDDFGPPGEVATREGPDDLGVVRLRFANNLLVNFKRTAFESDSVSLALRFGSGSLEPGAAGPALAVLANEVFVAGGLEAHGMRDLSSLFAGRSIGVQFRTGFDAFVLEARTSPGDLRTQLALLAAYLAAPGLRENALPIARKRLEARFHSARQTPEGAVSGPVNRFLHGGDPRFGLPDPEAVAALGLDDVRAWMEDALDRSRLELTVVGDFEPGALVAAVAATLGALPERAARAPPHTAARRVALPEPGARRRFDYEGETQRGVALAAWAAPASGDFARTWHLVRLAELLADRVRVHLRESLGSVYSYSVSRQGVAGAIGYGAIVAFVAVDPDAAATTLDALVQTAESLGAEGLAPGELQRVVAPAVARTEAAFRSNEFWIEQLSGSQEHPQRLGWLRTLRDTTAADPGLIESLAAEVFAPGAAIGVVVEPGG